MSAATVPTSERAALLDLVVEGAPDVIYLFDLVERRNVFANREVATLLGYTAEELQALGDALLPTLVHPDDASAVAAHHTRLAAAPARGDGAAGDGAAHAGAPAVVRYRMRHADGSWRWLESRDLVVRRDAAGATRLILGFARDATAEMAEVSAAVDSAAARAARHEAERAVARILDFEEASAAFVGSLAVGEILAAVQALLVPRLGDFCVVDLLTPDGALERVSAHHADPALADVAATIGRYPPPYDASDAGRGRGTLAEVLTTGQAIVAPTTAADLARVARSPEHLAALERLAPRVSLVVAVRGREAPLGVLTLVHTAAARPHQAELLPLLAQVGHRMGLALENARLYQDAQDARRAAQATFAQAAVGIARVGTDGRVLDANDRLAAMLGRPRRALLGENLLAHIHPADVAAAQASLGRLVAGVVPACYSERRFVRADGSVVWTEFAASTVRRGPGPGAEGDDGAVTSLVLVVNDVTARRAAEAERAEAEAALRRAETLGALGTLVGGVAHEVRNPLFGILSTLDALEVRLEDAGHGDAYARHLDALRTQATRLDALMRDLLEYGKPSPPELGAVDLRAVVEAAAAQCEARAQERGVAVALALGAAPVVVHADARRLAQVFENLVQNALQHSAAGGRVEVRLAVAPGGAVDAGAGDPGSARCVVADRGPGFAAADLPHVFEPFFSRRAGGTGLGLAIAHRIVEQHGGALAAGNRTGGGARLAVTLPLAS